jgi:hypothetical protein
MGAEDLGSFHTHGTPPVLGMSLLIRAGPGAASDCPSGCGRLARRAIFRFMETPNQWLNSGHPVPIRGAVARRHERGTGCGGRESVGVQVRSQGGLNLVSDPQARKTNDVLAYGKTVWS